MARDDAPGKLPDLGRRAVEISPGAKSDPGLDHVVEGRLCIHQVHALQPGAQAVGCAHQRVTVAASEVADVVAPQLQPLEARPEFGEVVSQGFDKRGRREGKPGRYGGRPGAA